MVNRTEQGMSLELAWRERGGPPPPRRGRHSGFGSRLIGMVVERQLGGKVDRTFSPEGLEVQLTIPLTHERWPQAETPPADDATPIEGL